MRKINGLLISVAFLSLLSISIVVGATDNTISAPARAGINQLIDVQFTGPVARGDMLRIATTDGTILGGHYLYVANLKSNTGQLSAPVEPGNYQVVYVSDGEIAAGTPLRVEPVTALVRAPASAGINDTIQVTVEGPNNKGDTLKITTSSGKIVRGYYAYVGNARDGTVNLKLPVEAGEYQVGYFTADKLIGTSPISVESVSASVTAPASVNANETFDVSFSGPRNNGDYLQFVDASGRVMRGLYRYVGNAKQNAVKLTAPVEAGNYTIGYFTGKQQIGSTPVSVVGVEARLTMDEKVFAGAHFIVDWEGPQNSGDMIRVLKADGASAGSYAYFGHNPDVVTLRAPERLGAFRVAYLTGGEVIGETSFTVVPVTAELDAPDEVEGSAQFNVVWEGPGNRGDTIQLINPDTAERIAYKYVDAEQGNVAVFLAPDVPGVHELHYITHGKNNLVTRSINITPAQRKPGSLQVVAGAKPSLGTDDAVEVILDASGSMLQRQAGERRIDIAKRTLTTLVSDTIPENTPFAMRVFGHKEADKCRTDLEIPLAPLRRAVARSAIANVTAMNLAKTPIADSIAQIDVDLAGVTGERVIVLLTDGEETCDGDPADVIAALRATGSDIRVNIVGYAIDDKALRKTFARWARLGGGEYFDVAEESELSAALISAVNPSFIVKDPGGNIVAQGVAGGEPIELAAGNYSIIAAGNEYTVEINPEQRSTVTLD